MQVTVHFTAEVKTPFAEEFFTWIATETLTRCPLAHLKEKEHIELNVVAVSGEKIAELNKTYRDKDAVTDILSFGEYATTEEVEKDETKNLFLGELFFCQEFIATSAKEDDVTLEHEMVYVFSHGVLHLLGYDHSDEMFALQDAVTRQWVERQGKRSQN